MFGLGVRPRNLPFPTRSGTPSNTMSFDPTSVPSCQIGSNLMNSLSRVHECDRRQTERPRYGEMCRKRWNCLHCKSDSRLKSPVCITIDNNTNSSSTFVWLSGVVVSALGMRTRRPWFKSRVAPLVHWVATLGKLFTHIVSPVSQLQETGVQKGVFGT